MDNTKEVSTKEVSTKEESNKESTSTTNIKRKYDDINNSNDTRQEEPEESKKKRIKCESKSIHPEMALNKRGIEPYFKINLKNINNKLTNLIKNIDFDSMTNEKLQEFDMHHKKIIIEYTNISFNFLQKLNNEINEKHKNTEENSSKD